MDTGPTHSSLDKQVFLRQMQGGSRLQTQRLQPPCMHKVGTPKSKLSSLWQNFLTAFFQRGPSAHHESLSETEAEQELMTPGVIT